VVSGHASLFVVSFVGSLVGWLVRSFVDARL